MSQYNEEVTLYEKVKAIKQQSDELLVEKNYNAVKFETLSNDEIENRLKTFQNSFYIDLYSYKNHKSIQLKYSTFKTITSEQNNMAAGFRWTEVITKSGKNIIDPNKILSKKEVNSFYINHDSGITNNMSLTGLDVPIVENMGGEELDYVSGEAHVSFSPGYDKMEITSSDLNQTKDINGIKCEVGQFKNSYVKLIFDYSTIQEYKICGYNGIGQALKIAQEGVIYIYKGGKTVMDYTEETLPGMDDIVSLEFHILFQGKPDKVKLFFEKPRVEKTIPIKTTPSLPDDIQADDYRSVADGVSDEVPFKPDYVRVSRNEKHEIYVKFDRNEALMEFNEPEISVSLPKIDNTTFARTYYKELYYKKDASAEYIPLKFSAREEGTISNFKTLVEHDNGSTEYQNADIIPGKSSIKGTVTIKYPTDIQWVQATPGENFYFRATHQVDIEGGLVTYYPPEGYEMPNIRGKSHYFIRAYNKNGRSLKLMTDVFMFPTQTYEKGMQFGFWGNIALLEIVIIDNWEVLSHQFEALAGAEETKNKGAEELAEILGDVLGVEVDQETDQQQKEKSADKNKGTDELEYKVLLVSESERKGETTFSWHGVLSGEEAFSEQHTTTLLREASSLAERAISSCKSKFRTGELRFTVSQLKNSANVNTLFDYELMRLHLQNDTINSLVKTIEAQQQKWTTPEPKPEFKSLSSFSSELIPYDTFVAKNLDYYEDINQEFNHKQAKRIYEVYEWAYNNHSAKAAEITGSMVAFVLGANSGLNIMDFMNSDVSSNANAIIRCMSNDYEQWGEIEERMLHLIFDTHFYDDTHHNLTANVCSFLQKDNEKELYKKIAKQIEKVSSFEQMVQFSFSLSCAWKKGTDYKSSVHLYLSELDFGKMFSALESAKEKDRCLRMMSRNNTVPFDTHQSEIKDFLMSRMATNSIRGTAMQVYILLANYYKKSYDDLMQDIVKSMKTSSNALWVAGILINYNSDQYTETTYQMLCTCLDNKSTLSVDNIDWLNTTYGKEKAQIIIDKVENMG